MPFEYSTDIQRIFRRIPLNIHELRYDSPMSFLEQITLRLGWAHFSVLRQLKEKEQDTRASIIRRAILEYGEKRGIKPETRRK